MDQMIKTKVSENSALQQILSAYLPYLCFILRIKFTHSIYAAQLPLKIYTLQMKIIDNSF